MSADLFTISGILYLLALVAYLFGLFSKKQTIAKAGDFIMLAGALLGLVAFIIRYKYYYDAMGRGFLMSFPVTNLFESVHFCVLCTVIAYLIHRYHSKNQSAAGAFIAALAGVGILLVAVSGFSKEPALFIPALQSYWLLAHVLLSFISYACFAVAAVFGILSIAGRNAEKQVLYANQIKTFVSVGFVLFTIGGMIFGAVWAKSAWGRFWSWDPKESWAFVTWCVYLVFIHLICRNKLKASSTAIVAIIGFCVVIFTFIGVNLLLSGLHTYGAS